MPGTLLFRWGAAGLALAAAQLCSGLLRPAPLASSRRAWRLLHLSCGAGCLAAGLAAAALGCEKRMARVWMILWYGFRRSGTRRRGANVEANVHTNPEGALSSSASTDLSLSPLVPKMAKN